MEKKCHIFVAKRLHFLNILDYIWTSHLKKFWTVFGLGLSFKKSGLDMDRKIWQFTHLCESSDFTSCTYAQSNIRYIKYAEKTDD